MPSLSDRSPSTSRPGSKPWERAVLTDTPNTPNPPSQETSVASAHPVPRPTRPTREAAVAGLAPRPKARPVPKPIPQKQRGRRSRVLTIGLALAATGLVGGAAIGAAAWALSPGEPDDSSFADAMAPMLTTPADVSTAPIATSTPAPVPAAPACVESNSNGVVTGSGPGSYKSGPDAILGFDHAYYVERSGVAARAFTTPDAAVGAADVLQRDGIDTFPSDTTHCLRITPRGPDEYTVELTHAVPQAQPLTWTQIVRTRTDGDRTLITSIVDITETEN